MRRPEPPGRIGKTTCPNSPGRRSLIRSTQTVPIRLLPPVREKSHCWRCTLRTRHFWSTTTAFNRLRFWEMTAGVAGNRMDLIVPASSALNGPADLRGRRLTCTAPSSITGYRAAIAVLMRDEGLRPNVDYEITWSLKQKASIEGIAAKKYDSASVSDEKLQALVEKGSLEASQYRIIYQTPVIQRTVIGYFYNPEPDARGTNPQGHPRSSVGRSDKPTHHRAAGRLGSVAVSPNRLQAGLRVRSQHGRPVRSPL